MPDSRRRRPSRAAPKRTERRNADLDTSPENRTAAAWRPEEAQGYLAAIVESSDDAIISKDLEGIIRYCNSAAERMFGYTASELIGRPVRILIPHDRQGEEDDILARLKRGERIQHFETIRVRKDGRPLHLSITVSPVRDASGTVIGASKVARDLADRDRADDLQAYLAAIVASSDDAIIAKDLDGIIQSANAAAERVFGYSVEELVGKPVRMLIPSDRQFEEDNILASIRRGGRIDHFETVRLRKDGELRDISLTVSPVRDAAGTIVGISKIARDVTDQKRAAAELAAQQAWFRVTLASIGDAVIATDIRGHIVFMNPVAEYLTGWRAGDALGQPCTAVFRIVNEDTGQTVESPVQEVLTRGTVVGLANHTLLISADGVVRPIDDSGAPIRDHAGNVTGVVLVFRDVSERRRLDAERQGAAAERERLLDAERSARIEAERASRVKDEFVAVVSHELRTPLNAILGWTQLMSQGRSDPEIVERGLEIVARNTRLQAQLISDLLDMSRIMAGKLQLEIQKINLPRLIEDAVDTLRGEAESKGIRLHTDVSRSVGPIAGDPARLQQVFWNLLANAIKFTPSGGSVTITLRLDGDVVEASVADTGVGIKADVLPRVFDRFHQADSSITRRFGGLGLGLSIVKHLVGLHGGTVQAKSPGEGKGATFTVSLPASTGPLDVSPIVRSVRAAEEPSESLEGLRVLVVEDEPDTSEFVVRLLRNHGAVVETASSAGEGLVILRERAVDIVLSDIGLPEVDGYDFIRRVRAGQAGPRDIPAIALTAYARSEDRTRALRAGYQGHLSKPIEAAELLATIASFRRVVDGQRLS